MSNELASAHRPHYIQDNEEPEFTFDIYCSTILSFSLLINLSTPEFLFPLIGLLLKMEMNFFENFLLFFSRYCVPIINILISGNILYIIIQHLIKYS